ncbi:MAG: AAA family ATPase [Flavobacteriaceae bacterium]|nr:AAA family ATPase [Flavobacteriaceae bacterium]
MNAPIDWRSIDVAQRLAELAHTDIVDASECMEDYFALLQREEEHGIRMPWGKLDALFELKPSTLSLMIGYSGHFKSTISAQMILSAIQQGKKVGLASLELTKGQIYQQLVDIASTTGSPAREWVLKFNDWIRGRMVIYDRTDAIAPEDATSMMFAMHDQGCDLIVLDALMMCGLEGEDYGAEKDFSQTVQAIAKVTNRAVLLLHHCRKPNGVHGQMTVPDKYDAMGSSNLANIANNVIVCWHNKNKAHEANQGNEVDDDEPDFIFKIDKHRGGRFEGQVGLYQHRQSRGFCGDRSRKLRPVL